MKKAILLAAVVAMLAAMALPAFATGPSAGVVNGNAVIGKTPGDCDNNGGTTNPGGAGLGLPIVNGVKTVYYRLTGTVVDVPNGTGTIAICGVVSSVSTAPAPEPVPGEIGGACGMSRGHSGKGKVDMATAPDVYLNNVRWPLTAGGTLPVTGDADTTAKGNKATITAVIQAQGAAPCATKAGSGASKTGGATNFVVAGTYTIA